MDHAQDIETPAQDGALASKPRPNAWTKDMALDVTAIVFATTLIALADYLFWSHAAGVSLILFSAAILAVVIYGLRPSLTPNRWGFAIAVWVACAAPIVELVQVSSVLVLLLGHLSLLFWLAYQSITWRHTVLPAIKAIFFAPIFSALSVIATAQRVKHAKGISVRPEMFLTLIVPILFGGVFALLLIGANPLLENWVLQLFDADPDLGDPDRVLFWAIVAAFVTPLAIFARLAKSVAPAAPRQGPRRPALSMLLNVQSLIISLAAFNAMFFVQNLFDIAILWGGAALPDHLTFAEYAHRGAYPLMATSILAALFVLMSSGYTRTSPVLRLLLLAWIAQNILLVWSALLRLDLYIDAYGLTYLRIRAGIGMGLVIVTMAALTWQIIAQKSNGWVTGIVSTAIFAVFYVGSFVNFAGIIADTNLQRDNRKLDEYHLCQMLPDAAPALARHVESGGRNLCHFEVLHAKIAPVGWRDWGWRLARATRAQTQYLALTKDTPVPQRVPHPYSW